MTAADLAGRMRGEGLDPSSWSNGPGDRYAAHSHGYDKVLVATAGSITFHLTDHAREVTLAKGDRLELPAGTQHAATVGVDGVNCLEAHLPAGTLQGEPVHRRSW
jgi:mannose-6-phosphate isomerase-like protein (cupin superfamily)